jgi:hypothetical protein
MIVSAPESRAMEMRYGAGSPFPALYPTRTTRTFCPARAL